MNFFEVLPVQKSNLKYACKDKSCNSLEGLQFY